MIHGESSKIDDEGYPVQGEPDVTVSVKSIQPLSLTELSDVDVSGTLDVLRVWAPAGTKVSEGDDVTIRGLRYRVRVTSWDWSRSRMPAYARHRPSVVFDCVRGAG